LLGYGHPHRYLDGLIDGQLDGLAVCLAAILILRLQ
jgi:hypothetical protein